MQKLAALAIFLWAGQCLSLNLEKQGMQNMARADMAALRSLAEDTQEEIPLNLKAHGGDVTLEAQEQPDGVIGFFSDAISEAFSARAMEATYKSFIMIGIAELFDKTWFVALLMALKYDKLIVFTGCFLALAAHTVLAAVLGYTVARLVPLTYLHFGAAALYAYFAILFFQDYQAADEDSDMIAAGKEEAEEDCNVDIDGGKDGKKSGNFQRGLKIFGTCFMAMFIAEWGDRTQIAMIGQHSSQPLIPVCVGSLVAFFLLTVSAVVAGALLANTKLSEKMVHLISCVSFAVFAVLSFSDGITQKPADMAMPHF